MLVRSGSFWGKVRESKGESAPRIPKQLLQNTSSASERNPATFFKNNEKI